MNDVENISFVTKCYLRFNVLCRHAMNYIAIDASKCYASGRGLQSRGIRVGDEAQFTVHTAGAGPGTLDVSLSGPMKNKERITAKLIKPDVYHYQYTPQRPGEYTVDVLFAGEKIPLSPFLVNVGRQKESNVRVFGPGLSRGVAGCPASFMIQTYGDSGVLGNFMLMHSFYYSYHSPSLL